MEKKIFAKHKILWLGRATGESRVWSRKALRLRALSEKLQLRREIMGRLTQRVLAFFSYKVKMKEKTEPMVWHLEKEDVPRWKRA